MKNPIHPIAAFKAIYLAALLAITSSVQAAPPDLTANGVIATIDRSATYNLGATGLRGWIYIGGGNGADGTITTESRQILVTVASAPANAVLAVDDVILGAMAGNSGTVPDFASDARKAFGTAIGDAEKTGAGTLRVKRWRAGTISDENIPMTIMGDFTATAPYSCPKSSLILTNARNKLVGQLLAPSSTILSNDWAGAINGLALLAGVQPGDPDYAAVQTRLQTYARSMAAAGPQQGSLVIWDWAYEGLFLAEYYLSTGDANVLSGINNYALTLAQSQSMYGTFGHNPSALIPDGRRVSIGYGPVNAIGIVANLAIVIAKKALVAGAQPVDPKIDAAIQRGSDFFAFYVNKGPIPYGEHEPFIDGHSSNGKDMMCAVLFGVQAGRTAETEYYSRMSTAGFMGREYGHTGQGFSYLWGALGANMGGELAVAEHLKPVRWHLDLSRRTDGSFAYDGAEQYGAGETSDGTYLGASGYYGMNATACYILTYSLPLKRLFITGKDAIPANTLNAAKVANAVAAATLKVNAPSFTTAQLIASLSEYDPVVRHYAAIELGKRTLNSTDLTTLRNMVTGPDANGRMGACQTLGLLKDATALPSITQRLNKTTETDLWVRAKAASAIRNYDTATGSTQRDTMLTHFVANATDTDVILWDDPIQMSNNYLSYALFGGASSGGSIATSTIGAAKNLLYPAVQSGLKQPDSHPRSGAARFCYDRLTLADVHALIPDLFEVIQVDSPADRMWVGEPRLQGIRTLSKHKISEGIPLALGMLAIQPGLPWAPNEAITGGLDALPVYGDAARWTLPGLREYLDVWDPASSNYTKLVTTIATIENAITAPVLVPGLAVANSQVVATTGPKAITLTGTSPRGAVTFTNVTNPTHGTLTGTAPNLTYTPNGGYSGPDSFTFQVVDSLGAANPSAPGTVSVIVGTAGTGLKGEYFDNTNFTNLKLTRTDAQVNFDWGTGTPNVLLAADTFSVRWTGVLLVPETGTYTFSTLNSDGARLYVNGLPLVDDYVDQTTNWKDGTSVNLTEGQLVDLQLDYYENTGSAVAKLKWTGPSFAGANGAIIGSQWLYDGTGMTRPPYAQAQSLNMVPNASLPITLTGIGGTLTYSVVTPPAHGTLTGTAPNLTYTPAANYNGPDSFTFLVNNGASDSAPATVSINIAPIINVWNVNTGNGSTPITTGDNYIGAATENTPNSTWNSVTTVNQTTLADSKGSSTQAVTFKITPLATSAIDFGSSAVTGDEIFTTWIKDNGNNDLFQVNFGNLPTNSTYDIVIYSEWPWANSSGVPVTQIAGTGLTGTFHVNHGSTRTNFSPIGPLLEDTNPANVNTTANTNFARIRGLSPDGGNNLTFSMGGVNAPVNGFQLVQISGGTTTTALALTSGTTPAAPGAALTFTATVTGTSPTGSVSFFDGATLLGTSALNGSFQAGFTTSSLAIGSHSITAKYAGNATHAISTSAALPVEIIGSSPAAPTNLLSVPGNNRVGLSWPLSPGASSYYVKRSLTNGGPYTVIGNPSAASYDDLTAINGNTYYYVVSASNAVGESANSSQVTGVPGPQPSATTLVSAPVGTGPYDSAVTFTATVTVSGGPATGTVTFRDGATVLGSGVLSAGTATFATSTLAVASHSITATYEGDATFGSSVSAPAAYVVTPKSLTITGVTASDKIYDGNATASLTGGTVSGGVVGGETVTVVPGNGTFASANVGNWVVTASGYSLGGANAGNYQLSAQPTVPTATITPRPVQLNGTRIYDATVLANASELTISNKVIGDDLTLTGSNDLVSKDVGTRDLLVNISTPAQVQSKTGFSAGNTSTSFTVTLNAAPASGNTLIAVISTRGTSAGRVNGITSTGAVWARVAQSTNSSGSTTEIWSAPAGSGATTGVTISTAAGRCAAVVVEYSGLLTVNAVDQIAASPGATSISPLTDTTPLTTQANELWIGGIGHRDSSATLGSNLNSFTTVASAQSNSATTTNNAKVHALERIVNATGTASTGGTLSSSEVWSGAIATFKAASSSSLALSGTAASNYTLTGLTGSVEITPKALTLTATPAVTGKIYDGLTTATLTGATLQSAETAGTGTTSDGKPYTGDTVTMTLSGSFDTKDAGTAKAVTSTSTLNGAQKDNYTLTQPTGVTGDITPAELTITANNQNKTYGQTLAFGSGATQFTSSGLLVGETIDSVTLTCTGGDTAAAVAAYPITPSAATGSTFNASNYAINPVPGLLTVSPAATTITTPPSATAITDGQTLESSILSGGVGSVAGTFGFSNPSATPPIGTASHSVTFTPTDSANYLTATTNVSVTVNAALPPFETWATNPAQGLTAGVNDGPLDDPDHDGFSNLMEFTLGGDPMLSSQAILPKLTQVGGNWVFSYHRSQLSKTTTTQVLEYGNGLTGWTPLTIPADSAGAVTITPGASSDHVEVTVPPQGANGFARLKVVNAP